MQFPTSKTLWQAILVLALIGLGLFVYFLWSSQGEGSVQYEETGEDAVQGSVSKINSPAAGTFQKDNFSIEVWDVSRGIADLDNDKCSYSVYDCKTIPCQLTVLNKKRNCNETIPLITVGDNKNCSSEGVNACRVIVKSADLDGNLNLLAEEDSIRDFSIDWTSPVLEMVLPQDVQKAVPQIISAQISDNVGLADCKFHVRSAGGQWQEVNSLSFIDQPCPSEEDSCYLASKEYTFLISGLQELYASCWDMAGNWGLSQMVSFEIATNHAPQISSCRVIPVQGTSQTDFEFKIEASDLDKDVLSYDWDFGDGGRSNEQNPFHAYSSPGTYEPKVIVSDGKAEEQCSTAWVGVLE